MKVRIITKSELEGLVEFNNELLAAIETAFVRIANQSLVMPPVQRMDFKSVQGEIDIKSAWYPGLTGFVVKMSTGFFRNREKGLPSGNGLMNLFCSETGRPLVVFLDGGYLTNVRTGIAGAVAAKQLCPDREVRVCLFGTGTQAAFQLRSLKLVKQIEEVVVFGRDASRSAQFCQTMSEELGISVRAGLDRALEIGKSNLMITTTPSREPLFYADSVNSNTLIVCMGSDAPDKNEIDPALIQSASLKVCDSKDQCFRMGEFHHTKLSPVDVVELGSKIEAGGVKHWIGNGIHVCDLTGTGAQDAAISNFVYEIAVKKEAGYAIEI